MIHKGMAVICRTQVEMEVLVNAVKKTPYRWVNGLRFEGESELPIRISFNIRGLDDCITKCISIEYPVNDGITEVFEASELFRNQIISLKRAKHEDSM